jgi:predicted alpha/beta hydrolase family esterase
MTKRAFIIHGYLSYPEEAWLPWMKQQLEARGYHTALPAMPKPNEPVIGEWLAFIADLVGAPDRDTILVGHSMGCQAVIRYLETVGRVGKSVGKTLLVAGSFPVARTASDARLASGGNEVLVPWMREGVEASAVKRAAGECVVILSDNDPYIDVATATAVYRAQLAPRIVIVPGGGHFNEDDKLTELPQAVEALFPDEEAAPKKR